MSPMCSIMVAMARGTMVMQAVMSMPVSAPFMNRPKTVASLWMGMPIQSAWATVWATAWREAGSTIMLTR